jgi:parvulin-like peptidyl-prolyl isomerase
MDRFLNAVFRRGIFMKALLITLALLMTDALIGRVEPVASAADNPSEVLATVNGEKITRGEVQLRIDQAISMNPKGFDKMEEKQRNAMLRNTLDRIIENKIVLQEAAKQGIEVSDEDVDRSFQNLRRQFSSDKELEEALKKAKTSIQMNKQDSRDYMMTRRLENKMAKQIVISENDIENYWEQSRQYLIRDKVKAKHILVKTEEEAKEIQGKLKKGEKFEALAKQYSQDTTTKDKGGDLGWIAKESVVKEFGDAAFALKVGEVSSPVKTQYGYHLILVEGKKNKDDQTLEDYREFIQNNLQQQRWNSTGRAEWVASLKAKAKIWNKLAVAQEAK